MRTLILILTFTLFGTCGFSQQLKPDQVPQNCKDRLRSTFPQTMDLPVSWSKEKKNYKASLTLMDTPAFIVIDSLGKVLRIERRIHENYLPQKAKDKMKSLDPNYQVVNVTQITDDKAKVTYKTVAKITTNFTFDSDGTVIGKK